MRNKITAVLTCSLLSIGLFAQDPKQVPLVLAVGKPTTVKNTITAKKSADNWIVDINKTEHYKIPEVFLTGG